MELLLQREPSSEACTLGGLLVDGRSFCWTLEDPVRERPGEPVANWKIPGRTAIPAGRYRVRLTWSQRFRRVLPLLDEVPGFAGIRIHAGNMAEDTEGCILVGFGRIRDGVTESRRALEALLETLRAAEGEIRIEIRNAEA